MINFSLLLIILIITAHAFQPSVKQRNTHSLKIVMAWPKTRPPVPNPKVYKEKMDAAWGRGKFRAEVWDDKVNPLNDWWEAYAPSDEEVEAAASGFDFKDPADWCQKNNIDYEQALKETDALLQSQLNQLEKEQMDLNPADFQKVTEEHMKLLNKAYLLALRVEDDRNQAAKGQPSLTNEDTGTQYKNDE